MRIVFVIGPSMSGKSFFIAREFPEAGFINSFTFTQHAFNAESNEEIEEILRNAQHYCREELKNRIRKMKDDDVIVLEHPMLEKTTRAFYLEGVQEVTDVLPECVIVEPSNELLMELSDNEQQLLLYRAYEKSIFELPQLDEGFGEIRYVRALPWKPVS